MATPQTPDSSTAPFISAANFLRCYSPAIVGNLLRATPSSPDPSYLAMIDPANPAGDKLLFHLQIGAGDIELACTVAKRYTPADLNALTGVSRTILWKLNAARGMWSLAQFLKPITGRMEDVPFAKESAEILELLTNGERIFGFVESMEAGLPSVVPPNPAALLTPNPLSRISERLFPGSGFAQMSSGWQQGSE